MASHVRVSHKTKDLAKSRRRWEVSYVDPLTGRKRTKGAFATKRDADDWVVGFEDSRRRGSYLDPASGFAPFAVAAQEWLAAQQQLKPRTRSGYAALIEGPRSALRERFAAAPVGEVRREDVQRFVSDLARAGRAPTTIRNHFYVLHQVFAEQVRRQRIAYNPCADIDLPKAVRPAQYEDERQYLTPEEVEALAGALPHPYGLLVRLAAYTGLRAGEIAGLQVGDVDTDAGVLRVRRTVVDLDGRLQYDVPKTARSRRTVALDSGLVAELGDYIAIHTRAAVRWFAAHGLPHPGAALPLFVGSATGRAYGDVRLDYGKVLRHGAWYGRHWKRALAAAGLPDTVRFHDLRHTYASWLVQDGVGFKDISEQMGHANITTTLDRYAHLNPQDSRERVRRAMAVRRATASKTTPGNVVPIRRPS